MVVIQGAVSGGRDGVGIEIVGAVGVDVVAHQVGEVDGQWGVDVGG